MSPKETPCALCGDILKSDDFVTVVSEEFVKGGALKPLYLGSVFMVMHEACVAERVA